MLCLLTQIIIARAFRWTKFRQQVFNLSLNWSRKHEEVADRLAVKRQTTLRGSRTRTGSLARQDLDMIAPQLERGPAFLSVVMDIVRANDAPKKSRTMIEMPASRSISRFCFAGVACIGKLRISAHQAYAEGKLVGQYLKFSGDRTLIFDAANTVRAAACLKWKRPLMAGAFPFFVCCGCRTSKHALKIVQ